MASSCLGVVLGQWGADSKLTYEKAKVTGVGQKGNKKIRVGGHKIGKVGKPEPKYFFCLA